MENYKNNNRIRQSISGLVKEIKIFSNEIVGAVFKNEHNIKQYYGMIFILVKRTLINLYMCMLRKKTRKNVHEKCKCHNVWVV